MQWFRHDEEALESQIGPLMKALSKAPSDACPCIDYIAAQASPNSSSLKFIWEQSHTVFVPQDVQLSIFSFSRR